MKIKLDENLGSLGVELLQQRGHDVMTVRDQGLCGATDDRLFEIYADERRVLITLDRDLGEVLRFPPEIAAGTVILVWRRARRRNASWIALRIFSPSPKRMI